MAIILFGGAAFRALAYIRRMIFVIVLGLARSGNVAAPTAAWRNEQDNSPKATQRTAAAAAGQFGAAQP